MSKKHRKKIDPKKSQQGKRLAIVFVVSLLLLVAMVFVLK